MKTDPTDPNPATDAGAPWPPPLDLTLPDPRPPLVRWHHPAPSPGLVLLCAIAAELVPETPKAARAARPVPEVEPHTPDAPEPDGEALLDDLAEALGLIWVTPMTTPIPESIGPFNHERLERHLSEWRGLRYADLDILACDIAPQAELSLLMVGPNPPESTPEGFQLRLNTVGFLVFSRIPERRAASAMYAVASNQGAARPNIGEVFLRRDTRADLKPSDPQDVIGLWGFAQTFFDSRAMAHAAQQVFLAWENGLDGVWRRACDLVSTLSTTADERLAIQAMVMVFLKGYAVACGLLGEERAAWLARIEGHVHSDLIYLWIKRRDTVAPPEPTP